MLNPPPHEPGCAAGHQLRVFTDGDEAFRAMWEAIDAAKEHVRTQFARIGVRESEVDIEVVKVEPGVGAPS